MTEQPPTEEQLERGRRYMKRVEAMMLAARSHVRRGDCVVVWNFPKGIALVMEIQAARRHGFYKANPEGQACIDAMRRASRDADMEDSEPTVLMVRAAWDLAKETTA